MASWTGIGSAVLVTGSNRGIGLGIVKQLVKCPEVTTIFAGCRDPEKADELNSLKASHPAVKPVKIDVQCDESIKSAFNEVKAALEASSQGGFNLLVNNSGILEWKGVSPTEPDRQTYIRHFDVNTVGVAVTSSVFLPLLKKAAANGQPARILNISSTFGSTEHVPVYTSHPSNNIVYGMTKAAVNHYSKALAEAEKDVVVVAMCPGWVQTDMGGAAASLTVEESTSSIVRVVSGLKPTDSGAYISHGGEKIPY